MSLTFLLFLDHYFLKYMSGSEVEPIRKWGPHSLYNLCKKNNKYYKLQIEQFNTSLYTYQYVTCILRVILNAFLLTTQFSRKSQRYVLFTAFRFHMGTSTKRCEIYGNTFATFEFQIYKIISMINIFFQIFRIKVPF